MSDYTKWRLVNGDEFLAQVQTSVPTITGSKAIHKALNGAIYIQTLGSGSRKTAVTIGVFSQAQKYKVDEANNTGAFLSYWYEGKTYFGFIEDEEIEWETIKPGEVYVGSFTMLIDHIIEDIL